MLEPAIISDIDATSAADLPKGWAKSVLQFCTIGGMEVYDSMEGVLLNTTFDKMLFYWSLWNQAIASECTFTSCSFMGNTFASSRFTLCRFEGCTFGLDNLGGQCRFDDSVFTECSFVNCRFVRRTDKEEDLFINTRFHGCMMEGCEGVDRLPRVACTGTAAPTQKF